MIRLNSRRHSRTALLLRRLSIGNGHARGRPAFANRLVDQSPLREPASAYRNRSIKLANCSTASQTAAQRTFATDRPRRNPHSV